MKHFKQFLFGALAMVASALLFTSCVDNLSEDYNLAVGVVKLIPCTVTAQNADNTKVSLDYNKQQRFESGDQLYVKGEHLEGTLDLVSGGGKTTATFQGTLTYTGPGSEPSPELALDLKLISAGDAIGNTEFLGGIASSMTEAVSKFSTLTAQTTYGQLNNPTNPTLLSQGTAFVDFTATLNPNPGDGDYEAVLSINGGATRLGAAEVEVLNGTTTFALAFPGGTTLNKPMVSILGQNFKFGGNNPTVEAAKIYHVNKTNSNDLYTPVTIEAITAGVVRVSIPKEFADEAIYGPYPAFPRFGCLSYVITDSDDAVVEEGSIGRDGQIQTKGDDDPSTKFNIVEIPVRAGDKVSFYGNNHMYLFVDPRYFDESIDEETRDKYYSPELEPDDMLALNITCPQASYIYGNVMSLVDSAGFATKTGFTQDLEDFALAGIFNGYRHGGNHIIFHNTRKLLLPAAELTYGCYAGMFGKCTLMEKTPDLPAYELAPGCYIGMFSGCSSLRTVSDFHVKEWPIAGCMYMFWDCTSLVKAPALTADSDEVGAGCFNEAFEGCTNLTTAPALPFTTLNEGCYMAMFEECEKLAAAPALPATELAEYCYAGMFSGCSNLRTVPILNAETMETDCYSGMFSGCTSLTTPPALPATTLAPGCYSYMFEGCTDLDTAPTLSVETLQVNCYEGMFRDCIHLTKAPELPAPTLVQACYDHMFYGCSSLNYIKCLATDISAEDCTYEWVQDVAPTGTFYRHENMTSWTIDANGIPTGWAVDPELDPDDAHTPLTMQAVNDGTVISIDFDDDVTQFLPLTMKYKTATEEQEFSHSVEITLNAGETIQLFGNNPTYSYCYTEEGVIEYERACYIDCSNDCYIYGNIMSLVDADDFSTLKTLTGAYNFAEFFRGQSSLLNHDTKKLLLPATSLTEGCYRLMFFDCSGLTEAPALPATTLQKDCYMSMFKKCTGIQVAPELLASELVEGCYNGMFHSCNSLSYIKCLGTSGFGNNEQGWVFRDWMNGVAENGTFVKVKGVDWPRKEIDGQGIPTGWTVIEE